MTSMVDPELFKDGACGHALPAGELLQEFRFGQFCPLSVLDGSSEARVVVGGNEQQNDDEEPDLGSTSVDKAGGRASFVGTATLSGRKEVVFAEVLQAEGSAIADKSSAIAQRPEMVIASGGLSRALPRDSLEDPMGGGDTKTELTTVLVSLKEEELSSYLANPWADLPNGRRIGLALSELQQKALTNAGKLVIVHSPYKITIRLEKSVPPAPNGNGNKPSGDTITGAPGRVDVNPEKISPQSRTYSPSRLARDADFGVLLALYFEWKQCWILKGFSRGRLLQSLALSPQEETTIELFTWDRRKKTLEQSSSMESEQSMEDEEKTQDTTEVFREMTKKQEFELKAGASLDLQYSATPVKIKLGADVAARDKTNAESVVRGTTKAISEGTQKSSARVKVQRSSKVTETTETGSEQRVTRKIRNPNMCHALNLDYYEILTHYSVITKFNEEGMRFCAMIPNPVAETMFERSFIRQHEQALRDALIDRSLAPGFDALRLLRARTLEMEAIETRRDNRATEPLQAPPNNVAPQVGISDEESAANNYLGTLQGAARKLMDPGLAEQLNTVFTCLAGPVGALKTRKGEVLPHDLDAGKRWVAQQLLLRSFSQLTLLLAELARASDSPTIREWGPRLAAITPEASAMPKPSQLNLMDQEVKEGLLRPAMWGPNGPHHVKDVADWGWWWLEIKRIGMFEADDAGVGSLIEKFSKVYSAFLDAARNKGNETDQMKMVERQAKNQDRQNDEDRLENDFPLRDYALAEERAEVLELHLKEHADHYSFALFQALPPQEQLNFIERSMALLKTGFDPGFFEPRVVSQIGSRLLVPLNHEVIDKAEILLADLKRRIQIADIDDTVLLPSPGLTIEARLGQCSATETFINETRRLDLELRHAEVRQACAEADRLEKRVTKGDLEEPTSHVPRVAVDLPLHSPNRTS